VEPGLYLRGVAIGLAVAFALGPIGLLVIRRTIDRGWAHGLLSGVGVATADALYAAVAAFGLTAVTQLLVGIGRPLGVIGGLVLIALAARALLAVRSGTVAAEQRESGPPGSRAMGAGAAWGSMVGLTLTNPATILSFAALFASIGETTGGAAGAATIVAGVFTGSIAWWAILTALVAGLRARLTPRVVGGLNVASALIIGAFGVAAVALGLRG
jgi:threonine/homoserine/homoserine lactone efflux protein